MQGIVTWFARNSTAANLLMLFLIGAGFLSLFTMKQEVFPEIKPNIINIATAYPGATPEQIEEAVCIKIEEAVDGIEGVKRITSTSNENAGFVTIEMFYESDWDQILSDVKSAVDGITTFPDDVEKPTVTQVKMQAPVLQVAIAGELDERDLRQIGEDVRDEITALKGITHAKLSDSTRYEISVEVSEETLREYELRFDDLANAIRSYSINLSGGTIKAKDREILIRGDDQVMTGADVEQIPVLTLPDGTQLLVKDFAEVHDGFEDVDQRVRFNGKPAVILYVNRVGQQSVPVIAEQVHDFVETKQAELDAEYGGRVKLRVWDDWSVELDSRKNLLIKNGIFGFILIFIILALFLEFKLALWVTLGISTAGIGTFWLMPMIGDSINMMSLFAFIVVLGIMVDDAIVVSENIHFHRFRLRKPGMKAAVEGTKEVLTPVVIAVLTTVAAFLPMATMSGTTGQFASAVPRVVILALALSLVESLLILPAHLAHLKEHKTYKWKHHPAQMWSNFQKRFNGAVDRFVDAAYRPSLRWATRWRYLTMGIGFAVVLMSFSLVVGKQVKFIFFPAIEGDKMIMFLNMPAGTPADITEEWISKIEDAGRDVLREASEEAGVEMLVDAMVTVGTQPTLAADNWEAGGNVTTSSHLGEVKFQLIPPTDREDHTATQLLNRWREKVGVVPGAEELSYKVDISGTKPAIGVQLMSSDLAALRSAADELKAKLQTMAGGTVIDIKDDMRAGKPEYRPKLKPQGIALGLTQAELVRQVRQAFYGEEVQRYQRGRDDVKIFVRYPLENRSNISDIEELRLRLPNGAEVPFRDVATAEFAPGLSSIHRARRERAVEISADVDNNRGGDATVVNAELRKSVLPGLIAKYPGMIYSMEGQQADQAESMGSMKRGTVVALLLIFSLLALAFSNFMQPLIVMTAIPFGVCGAILGHWGFTLLSEVTNGYVQPTPLTILSFVGILAMSGVVVNDSMIMVDFINRARAEGVALRNAVLEAGPRRFRAIIITSLTTFAGLAPMLTERSVQAQFLIPMAIALAFGVTFSTAFILIFVPASYMVLDDILTTLHRGWNWLWHPAQLKEEEFERRREAAPSTQTGADFSTVQEERSRADHSSIFESVLDVSEKESSTRSQRRRSIETLNASLNETEADDSENPVDGSQSSEGRQD